MYYINTVSNTFLPENVELVNIVTILELRGGRFCSDPDSTILQNYIIILLYIHVLYKLYTVSNTFLPENVELVNIVTILELRGGRFCSDPDSSII